MRIIAIETSGRDGSLAAIDGDAAGGARVVREAEVTGPERTAQFLAPRLYELLEQVAWPASSIQFVSVAVGPGSFTGLRIGVTTAKTLAYAVGAEVIGVNSLSVIARQAPQTAEPLWVVMDAQRQELFAAKFVDGQMMGEVLVVPQKDWLSELQPGDAVTGPGLKRLRVGLSDKVTVVDESRWQPLAAAVGQIGWQDYASGRRDDLWKLLPQYYRQSAAEEKAAGKSN